MSLALRLARAQDFGFCRDVYFAEMEWIIDALRPNRAAQCDGFQQQWVAAQVRIIVQDGLDVGWVQTLFEDDALGFEITGEDDRKFRMRRQPG